MGKMKKMLSLLCTAALTAAGFAGCSGEDKESGKKNDGKFTVSVEDIAEDMGAGWNLGNTLEASSGGNPSETVWGNPEASQEIIDMVADAGFNTIRVPVSYLNKIDDDNGYKIDEAWLERVEEVVNYCYERDLYVIINIHGDGYNSVDGGWLLVNGDDQETINKKYEAVWKQIAEHFADYDEHLIFESMNEVFNGEYADPIPEQYENLNTYNQIFVDTVRATGSNNTHRWLMVPGWNTNIDYTCGDYGFVMPTDENNSADEGRMLLSVHCYDPWDYCGQESIKTYLWGAKGDQIVSETGVTDKTLAEWGEEDYLEGQFQKLKTQFVDKGIPVVIGEYGCIDKTSAHSQLTGYIAQNRVYYNGFLAGTAASMGIIPVYWDNGYNGEYGFGLFNRKTLEQTQPEIISTIVNAVKNKNPQEGAGVMVNVASDKKSEAHAYIGIQTNVYTFRNAYDDATYGMDSEWFNTLIKWEDTDGDGKDDIVDTGAVFEDAAITGNGTYTVGVSGYDFSQDSEALNMLFISSDIPYSNSVGISDVKLYCDDKEYSIDKPVVMADASGNLYIEIVNIYNTDLAALDYEMPTDSFKVTFTVNGASSVIG
ncbi:MAG: glycoside hydrolase family 5 protein [Ruminococcus sp.]|nr:glycoside hydrolase family 5 protein [Ruminococcus sp.]